MKKIKVALFCPLVFLLFLLPLSAQQSEMLTLTLEKTVELANDSSLSAFRAKNMYMASQWEFTAYKAARLPSLTFNATPLRYNRDFTRRYDSSRNVDVYRSQQSFYSFGNFAVQQNLDLIGGTFYIDTELGYIHNFGGQALKQFSSVPVRIGYRQNLLGYNRFKWERKIEPLKFERAQKELIANLEATAEKASDYFFDLALAQSELQLAQENVQNSKHLYHIGEEKYKNASIGQSELLTLKLDYVNAQNSLQNAELRLKRAMFAFSTYLNLDKNTHVRLELPSYPKDINVNVEEALMHAKNNNPIYLENQQRILESKTGLRSNT